MVEENTIPIVRHDLTQLGHMKTPLDVAADAFVTRDAWGRLPVTLIPIRPKRIRENILFIVIGPVAAAAGALALGAWWIVFVALLIAAGLATVALWPLFIAYIPVGVHALIVRNGLIVHNGKYVRTIGSGVHFVPPWFTISHLVTSRRIPLDVCIAETQTKDNVRAAIDTLFTFTIADPYRFVFSGCPDNYDRVIQAYCQESLRILLRGLTAEEAIGLMRIEPGDLAEAIQADFAAFGVQIVRVMITSVRLSQEFVRMREQQRLATLQQVEAAAAHQELLAHIEHERATLQFYIHQAEALRSASSSSGVGSGAELGTKTQEARG